jgi:large subunit ribosomal protein L6
MSRIGKKPISIIDGVKVSLNGNTVSVEGPLGKLNYDHRPEVTVAVDSDSKSVVVGQKEESREARAYHGLTRALISNMITGVKTGYEKKLELQGVGYVVNLQGKTLTLRLGFANEIKKQVPDGLNVVCPDNTHINISGCDKQQVGEFAAEVRASRKPEPYKGKGIRYVGEYVKIKPGKAAS